MTACAPRPPAGPVEPGPVGLDFSRAVARKPRTVGRALGRAVRRKRRAGFSLVEVLAALTILSIMMILLTRMFNDSVSAWRTGTGRADMDSAARAALEFMAAELGALQADDVLTMRVESLMMLGRPANRVSFVSLSNTAEIRNNPYREGMQIRYTPLAQTDDPNRFFLGRWVVENEGSPAYTAYTSKNWYATAFAGQQTAFANTLTENITGFRVIVYDQTRTPQINYNSETHGPPLWLDLYLEMVNDNDAVRAGLLAGALREQFLQQKARRYTMRVFPHNRQQPITW